MKLFCGRKKWREGLNSGRQTHTARHTALHAPTCAALHARATFPHAHYHGHRCRYTHTFLCLPLFTHRHCYTAHTHCPTPLPPHSMGLPSLLPLHVPTTTHLPSFYHTPPCTTPAFLLPSCWDYHSYLPKPSWWVVYTRSTHPAWTGTPRTLCTGLEHPTRTALLPQRTCTGLTRRLPTPHCHATTARTLCLRRCRTTACADTAWRVVLLWRTDAHHAVVDKP